MIINLCLWCYDTALSKLVNAAVPPCVGGSVMSPVGSDKITTDDSQEFMEEWLNNKDGSKRFKIHHYTYD